MERAVQSSTILILTMNVSEVDATEQADAASTMASIAPPQRNVCQPIASTDSAATTIAGEPVTLARPLRKAAGSMAFAGSSRATPTRTTNARASAMARASARRQRARPAPNAERMQPVRTAFVRAIAVIPVTATIVPTLTNANSAMADAAPMQRARIRLDRGLVLATWATRAMALLAPP
jgi:hypothetical protein